MDQPRQRAAPRLAGRLIDPDAGVAAIEKGAATLYVSADEADELLRLAQQLQQLRQAPEPPAAPPDQVHGRAPPPNEGDDHSEAYEARASG